MYTIDIGQYPNTFLPSSLNIDDSVS